MEAYKHLFMENSSRLIGYGGMVVLEVGCGNGDMLREIARKFRPKYIVGIDSDLEAWETPPAKGLNWEIAPGDAAGTVFSDNFFDAAISVGVFEHLLNLKGALAEVRRVLKHAHCTGAPPGGRWKQWPVKKRSWLPAGPASSDRTSARGCWRRGTR